MSIKRRPVSDLNHDNWDQDEEPEEQGEFKKASQDEIAKRTIKTAKRRVTSSDNDTGTKPSSSMFSSFAGFGKDNGKSSALAFSFLSSAAPAATAIIPTNGDSASSTASKLPSVKESAANSVMDDKSQLDYYANLKGLNQSIADWITKKVEQNPFCILTPIFDDYAKHLQTIQEKNKTSTAADTKLGVASTNTTSTTSATAEPAKATFSFAALAPAPTSTPFSNLNKPMSFFQTDNTSDDNKALPAVATAAKPPTFSFGALTSTAATNSTFSFGGPGVKPFTFSNVAKPVDSSSKPSDTKDGGGDEADDDQPPKYEFVPVVEKDNFYSKRCKVFVKSDKSYADRGVGMLYLKKVEGSAKTQLLVRADTSLGNILLNVLLTEGLPTQRMGKKDVMMICLPLPDAKGPTSVLIRVKDEEEANDLLAEIIKNKK